MIWQTGEAPRMLETKKGAVYGPVQSRRLGKSLGINVLPRGRKACTFDCVYCQYGRTQDCFTPEETEVAVTFPSVPEVRDVVVEALYRLKAADRLPHYVTFSGNGEPTLHPRFPEMVDTVIAARDELAPGVRTAILSNSSQLGSAAVREALVRLDLRILKLDCGSEACFLRYNRPAPGISIEEITDGLVALSRAVPVTIQTLFAAGKPGNLESESIAQWISRLQRISPALVQLYTLDRGYPEKKLLPAPRRELDRIRSFLEGIGISANVY